MEELTLNEIRDLNFTNLGQINRENNFRKFKRSIQNFWKNTNLYLTVIPSNLFDNMYCENFYEVFKNCKTLKPYKNNGNKN
jgi:hypothetical protein